MFVWKHFCLSQNGRKEIPEKLKSLLTLTNTAYIKSSRLSLSKYKHIKDSEKGCFKQVTLQNFLWTFRVQTFSDCMSEKFCDSDWPHFFPVSFDKRYNPIDFLLKKNLSLLWYTGPLCQKAVTLGSGNAIFGFSMCLEEENHHLEILCRIWAKERCNKKNGHLHFPT